MQHAVQGRLQAPCAVACPFAHLRSASGVARGGVKHKQQPIGPGLVAQQSAARRPIQRSSRRRRRCSMPCRNMSCWSCRGLESDGFRRDCCGRRCGDGRGDVGGCSSRNDAVWRYAISDDAGIEYLYLRTISEPRLRGQASAVLRDARRTRNACGNDKRARQKASKQRRPQLEPTRRWHGADCSDDVHLDHRSRYHNPPAAAVFGRRSGARSISEPCSGPNIAQKHATVNGNQSNCNREGMLCA